jgi:hypothetical protein
MPDTPANPKELALVFFRLRSIAFGGPPAHVSMMEHEVVKKRQNYSIKTLPLFWSRIGAWWRVWGWSRVAGQGRTAIKNTGRFYTSFHFNGILIRGKHEDIP